MALFKIFKGNSQNLPASYKDGYCYFTIDDGKMYIDTTNDMNGRVCLNAEKADKLSIARTITLSGDVSGSASFDGSKNITITSDLSNTGVAAGYYGLNTNTTGSNGATVAIPYLNIDEDGRILSAVNKTYTAVDTNDKVTQTLTSSNLNYPLLLGSNGQTATTTNSAYFDSGVTLNPSTNTIAANISGNAATATKIYTTVTNPATYTNYRVPFTSGSTNTNNSLLLNNGFEYHTREGTTSAVGCGLLVLGNGIASGTAGNKYGGIVMYGEHDQNTVLYPSDSNTSQSKIYLPSSSGTLALTSSNITGTSKGISYTTALETIDAVNAFFTPSVLQVACLTSTASYEDIGLTGNDGMIISIPWRNDNYGVQLGFDDNTNGLIKIRGKANGTWGTWKKILIEDDANNYVKKTGDTMTGKLQVNHTIFSCQYVNSNNRAAFMLDKPGNGYTGIGANAESSTIYFGPCDANGDWLTEPYQNWKFYGDIYAGGGNDSYGIHPWKNNYSTLGRENLYWWKAYVTYIYSNQVTGAVWNDYAEYRNQKEEIKPGYCVTATDSGKVYKTTTRLQPCDGVVSDTFGFAIGKTDECKTPLAVAGRVLVYCAGDRNNYHFGDCVCAGPNGLAYKMTNEEIRNYPHRIIGTVSEIPNYKVWGSGNVEVNGRIWIKVK